MNRCLFVLAFSFTKIVRNQWELKDYSLKCVHGPLRFGMIEACRRRGNFVVKKWVYIALISIVITTLVACSKKETPEQRLSSYIDLWKDEKWTAMYAEYVTTSTMKNYGEEQFIARTEKLYEDLGITSVEIEVKEINDKRNSKKEEDVELPVNIKMETIAGTIEFTKDVLLTYEAKEKGGNWFIEWDPSFVLPGLTMEDKVNVSAIQSERGEIYDRHEKPLAINGSGAEIGLVAGSFNSDIDSVRLGNLLGMTADYIHEQLNQSWIAPGHFVPLKKLPFTQENVYNEALQIPGVTSAKANMREYPYAKALAHLIGYTGQITGEELEKLEKDGYTAESVIGKRGLEQLLEKRLRGEDGIGIYIEKPDEERLTIAEKPAVDGETIKLTIDAEYQRIVYDEMAEEPGTAAVVDPKTGETIVLVSSPAFDPNELSLGVSASRYATITDDPAEPMLNRFTATYAPGSAIKPITAAIGLTAGTLKSNDVHTIQGMQWQKDNTWGDFKVTRVFNTPNPVDLKKALVYSDNIYFAKEALKLTQEKLVSGFEQYGFGEEMPFPYNVRTSQVSNDGKIESEGQLVDTSFGQGQMLMNILHLATTYEAIINDGKMIKPILFSDEVKGEIWKDKLVSAEHAAILKEDLRAVVTDGFVEEANISTLKISGKTGTAELKQAVGERGKENGFFVAYPTDTEAYIIAMMIENVQNKGGSNYVAGKVANVMSNK